MRHDMNGSYISIKRGAAGFTLIELMIVLVIVAVVLAIALPGFSEISTSTRLKTYANELLSGVHLARGEAIKRNAVVRLCTSTDGTSCAGAGDWEQGWVVMDPNDTVIRYHPGLANGFKMVSSGGAQLNFQPTGAGTTPSNIKVCQFAPKVGTHHRTVYIGATGRPRVEREQPGTPSCP